MLDVWYIDCLHLTTRQIIAVKTIADTTIFHLLGVSKCPVWKDYVGCLYSSGWRKPFCVGCLENFPRSDKTEQAPWIIGSLFSIYVKMVAGKESMHSSKLSLWFHGKFFSVYALLGPSIMCCQLHSKHSLKGYLYLLKNALFHISHSFLEQYLL